MIWLSCGADTPKIREGFFPGAGLISRNCSAYRGRDNMELSNMVLTAISTVGFPIVVAGAMFWKMNKQDDDHKEEMQKVTEAINNNTIALTKLIDKLDA